MSHPLDSASTFGTGVCAGADLFRLERKGCQMNSGLIGKIEKAKRYAQERNRIHVRGLRVDFAGENDGHEVSLEGDTWRCSCNFFAGWGACAHTMALERIFEGMLPRSTLYQQQVSESA